MTNCNTTTNWKSDFLHSIQFRNSRQTDCFIDMFSSYTAITEHLRRLLTPQQQLEQQPSSLQYDSEEELLDISGEISTNRKTTELLCRRLAECTREKKNIIEKNLALRDQVRILETRVRTSDQEVCATRSCLKELEIELRDKESKLYEMVEVVDKLSVKNIYQEGDQLKKQISTLMAARERLSILQECHQDVHQLPRFTSNSFYSPLIPSESYPKGEPSPALTARSVPTPRPCVTSIAQSEHHSLFRHPESTSPRQAIEKVYQNNPLEDQSTHPSSSPETPTNLKISSLPHCLLGSSQRAKMVSRPHSGSVSGLDLKVNINQQQSKLLVSGGYDGYLALLDPITLSVCYSFRVAPNESAIVTLRLSEEDNTKVIAVCLDCNLYIADLEKQKTSMTLKGHTGKVTGCGFFQKALFSQVQQTAKFVYSVSLDRFIRLWDITKGNSVTAIACSSGISCSASTGSKIAVGHVNGCVSLWEADETVATGLILQKLCVFQPLAPSMRNSNPEAIHEGHVAGVCFSPDGTKLYSVGKDGRIAELSVTTGQMVKSFHLISSFRPPTSGQNSICLPNEDIVVTASTTGLLCWEARTGRCIMAWDTPAPPSCVTWTGESLCSGHTDGTIILWGI